MGDRGQVLIKDEGVYLYTHWGASDLISSVHTAIKKGWRWDDPEYLARIVYDSLVGDEFGEELGFGIGTSLHGDIWRLISLNCSDDLVEIYYVKGESKKRLVWSGSFQNFSDLTNEKLEEINKEIGE